MSTAWVGVGIAAVSTISGMASGKKAQKAADAQAKAALEQNAWQGEIAKEQYQDYKDTYRPLEQQMVHEAQQYDTDAAYERAASEAQATTSQQIGLAEARLGRTPGLDPSSGAAMAARSNLALQGAALGATSQNAARAGVRDKAWARKMDALGLGKGLVTNASNGAANSARVSAGLAESSYARANQTAAGTGAMITGLGTMAIDAYKKNNPPGNGGTIDNTLF